MKVLVFGAHPDDMEIGMGGTIAKHAKLGDTALMVVSTVPSQRERRREEMRRGAEILGAQLYCLDVPPEEMEYNRRLIRQVDALLESFAPDLIYTHWDQDSHQDHNTISRSVISAARKNRCSLLMYEQTIPGGIVPGGFKAQSFVDISDCIDLKIASVRAHQSQHEVHGDLWLQGVKGRAMYRGYQINVAYAEAFEVVKEIEVHFRHR
ncbi:MAG: PIG-L family deacetylase [Deltaproteobacteria bacterium]|nr:PIG-L family deacetylase [Deltaproteobacteria bacterium]